MSPRRDDVGQMRRGSWSVEGSYGAYERSLELPESVNADIGANNDEGVLKVVVPKPAPKQVKKVELKAAA